MARIISDKHDLMEWEVETRIVNQKTREVWTIGTGIRKGGGGYFL